MPDIRDDNGPEFVSNALNRWSDGNAVTLDFSMAAKAVERLRV